MIFSPHNRCDQYNLVLLRDSAIFCYPVTIDALVSLRLCCFALKSFLIMEMTQLSLDPQIWKISPPELTLPPGMVHIWLADLNQSDACAAWLEQTLGSNERERANRFRFPHLRRNYVIRQGILRNLLGRYTGTDAAAINFSLGPAGKPALTANPKLQFNMSQSQHLALYGFTLEHEIGVDIEFERPLDDLEVVARYYFAEEEITSLFSLPPDQHITAFIKCWSRKEAFIKAVGQGLRYPLNAFAVTLAPDVPARLLRVDAQPEAVNQWRYATFDMPGEFAAAAIVTHPHWQVAQWQWTHAQCAE